MQSKEELKEIARELWRTICHAAYKKLNSFNSADVRKYSEMKDKAEAEYKAVIGKMKLAV